MKNKLVKISVGSMVAGALLMSGTSFADTIVPQEAVRGQMMKRAPGVFGTVTKVSGISLTVTDTRTNTVYTIDASKATVKKQGEISSIANIAVGDTIMAEGTINGTSVSATVIRDGIVSGRGQGMMGNNGEGRGQGMMGNNNGEGRGLGALPGTPGTVVSINGSTMTMTSKIRPGDATPVTTYMVAMSNATVLKNRATSTISSIAVGDNVVVQGAVSGTSITATVIHDGALKGRNQSGMNDIIDGNGQPVIGGTITSISGTTFKITNKSNIAYTIDASGAKVKKGGVDSTISGIAVGDSVLIQGTINGTSITASSVIDQGTVKSAEASTSNTPAMSRGFMGGIFGAIGNFFHTLF
jgi:hypothetical protein